MPSKKFKLRQNPSGRYDNYLQNMERRNVWTTHPFMFAQILDENRQPETHENLQELRDPSYFEQSITAGAELWGVPTE